MTGPRHLDGVERSWAHLGDMIAMALLLIIMWSAIADDGEVAGCTSNVCSGLGVNPKTLLWLFLLEAVVEIFLYTDFMSYTYMLNDPDASSDVAQLLWKFYAIYGLILVLAFFFAIGYGDCKDQESTIMTYVAMMIVSGLVFLGTEWKDGMFRQWLIWVIVYFVLAVVAVWGGRREGRGSSGYTEVGNA